MHKVNDLQPGDEVRLFGIEITGVFIAKAPHQRYPGLELVVWKLSDGTWSYDALSPEQDIGYITPSAGEERGARLLNAFIEEKT